ncbi:hypothetical protein SISNIDRAFT_492027 [Sistotremastrum niveocremeum HHB9708]|uniref:Replication factor A protein 3 n=1 Tax=Sistotremastrum niveocremeum HHB9708 TaxID=1314777 RepID=A0A164M4M9_9AGAM|nr:hypothetical protein SISNIDRAFT_492027 [Sistotremastrum niveocremeum HHB9708]
MSSPSTPSATSSYSFSSGLLDSRGVEGPVSKANAPETAHDETANENAGDTNTDIRVTTMIIDLFIGQNVRIVGKVVSNEGTSATLRSSHGELTHIILPENVTFTDSIIEVVGLLESRRVIRMSKFSNFGNDEGIIAVADRTVPLMHKQLFADMFGKYYEQKENASSATVQSERTAATGKTRIPLENLIGKEASVPEPGA